MSATAVPPSQFACVTVTTSGVILQDASPVPASLTCFRVAGTVCLISSCPICVSLCVFSLTTEKRGRNHPTGHHPIGSHPIGHHPTGHHPIGHHPWVSPYWAPPYWASSYWAPPLGITLLGITLLGITPGSPHK